MYSKCIIVYQRYPCSLHKVGHSLRYRTPFIKSSLFLLERKNRQEWIIQYIYPFFNSYMYLEEASYLYRKGILLSENLPFSFAKSAHNHVFGKCTPCCCFLRKKLLFLTGCTQISHHSPPCLFGRSTPFI